MKSFQLKPVQDKHTNRIFAGYGPIGDLPATVYRIDPTNAQSAKAIASHYKLTFKERIKFLFDGRIYVSVLGNTQPPLSIVVGGLFDKE